jgi:dihydroneopterin aldolase
MTEKRRGRIASSSETGQILDRIFVHDYVRDVEIGVYHHEKGVTQRVRFSVDVDVIPSADPLDDDIGRAFDYDTIVDGIKAIMARGHINLVETLAEEVAEHCLAHPRAARVTVSIEKLDKDPGAVGVEIIRRKTRT